MGECKTMRHLLRMTKRRVVPVLGACALMAAGIGASAFTSAPAADAAACVAGVNPAGTPCSIVGTAVLSGGTITLTPPASLNWATTLTGAEQHLVDTSGGGADETYKVVDATGTATGWHVTAAATTFSTTGGTVLTLPDTTTLGGVTQNVFATNGSIGSMTVATAPSATCATGTTCTLPTDTAVSYPVAITTSGGGTTPTATIYDAAAGTGLGAINIGTPGTNPVGWWLNIPSNTQAGTYTSLVTLELLNAP
jgi:hypothetical protein